MRTTELLARMRLDASQFDKSLKQSSTELQAFARVTNALPTGRNNPLSSLAGDAAAIVPALSSAPLAIAAVGASLAATGVAARKAGVEFEAALTKISTLGDDATANLGATRQAILDTFASTAVTGGVTDLAEANYLLQSSGRSAAEAIVDLDVAAKASVAGYTQVTTAVDGLTTITAAWKDQQISTQRASDVLFASVSVGKATFEELASQIGLVAPLAASMGIRFEEVAGASALLSNQGLRTSSIMEGLRSALLNVQSPTEDFKKKYGDLAREFTASRLARDGVIKFLQDFDQESGGSRSALRALFSDATAFTTVLGLLRNGGKDASDALRQMEDAAGATDRAVKKVNESAKAQEQLIRNQISSAWTQFGEMLSAKTLPVLEAVARAINDISDGAAFAQRDVQTLLSRAGKDALGQRPDGAGVTTIGSVLRGDDQGGASRAELGKALTSIIRQFNDDQKQFLKALSRDDLQELEFELRRIQQSGLYQNNPQQRISGAMLLAINEERLKRDVATRDETQAAFNAREEAEAKREEQDKQDEKKRLAEQARIDAERRARELAAERKRIVEDAAKLTQDLKAQAIEALQGTAGAMQNALQTTISDARKKLASGALSDQEYLQLDTTLAQFEELKSQLIAAERAADATKAALDRALQQEEIPALQTIAARERELQIQLAGTRDLAARKKIEEQLAALAKARGEQTENVLGLPDSKSLDAKVREIGDLTQSIATLGDQLGLLPARAVDAVRGIGALIEQSSQLEKLFAAGGAASTAAKFASGIGIAAGVASLAAGLFGTSPEQKQQREELRRNTEALRTLSENVGDLANSTAPGRALAGARSGIAAVLQETGGGYPGQRDLRAFGGDNLTGLRGLIANRGGITVSQLDEAIKGTGLTLNESVASLQQILEFLNRADRNAYGKNFASSLQRLEDTLRVDGVTDGIEALRRRVEVLTDKTTGFPALAEALDGIDLSTVEGRSTALDRARALFNQVANGDLPFAQFGGLSVADARTTLVDLITQLRDANGGSGTGGFNETRSITEVTGSRLAGLLGTANTYLAQMAADIAALRSAMVVSPPVLLSPPPIMGLAGGASGAATLITFAPGAITFSVQLDAALMGAGAGKLLEAGQMIGRAISDRLMAEIDQQLHERLLRKRLLYGDSRVTT